MSGLRCSTTRGSHGEPMTDRHHRKRNRHRSRSPENSPHTRMMLRMPSAENSMHSFSGSSRSSSPASPARSPTPLFTTPVVTQRQVPRSGSHKQRPEVAPSPGTSKRPRLALPRPPSEVRQIVGPYLEGLFDCFESLLAEVRSNGRKIDRLALRQRASEDERQELLAAVRSNGRQLDYLAAIRQGASVEDSSEHAMPEGIHFPLLTEKDLIDLEDVLLDVEVRKRMVGHLGNVGGADYKKCAREVLARVLSVPLARKFNLTGQRGKLCMGAYTNVMGVVHESVRKLFPDATEDMVQKVFAGWLSGARDREGGRAKRLTREQDREPQWEPQWEPDMEVEWVSDRRPGRELNSEQVSEQYRKPELKSKTEPDWQPLSEPE
ncbi:uncharacterized protein [Littorina saxatilis]|uniref:uncharacterized protein n=1 Tax=Littorina saxatilis TaxID=31220 RepID=UPI0038B5AA0B